MSHKLSRSQNGTFGVYFNAHICWNGQIAEDVRERWETSDNPIVHKIQEYAALNLPTLYSSYNTLIRLL